MLRLGLLVVDDKVYIDRIVEGALRRRLLLTSSPAGLFYHHLHLVPGKARPRPFLARDSACTHDKVVQQEVRESAIVLLWSLHPHYSAIRTRGGVCCMPGFKSLVVTVSTNIAPFSLRILSRDVTEMALSTTTGS